MSTGAPTESATADAAVGRWARLVAPLSFALIGAVGTVLVFFHDPNQPGSYGICPSIALTGRPCAGCGGLRAVHALTHGDVALALDQNVLVVAAIPVAAIVWLIVLRRAWVGAPARPRLTLGFWLAVLAILLVFTVVRNIPAFSYLAPS